MSLDEKDIQLISGIIGDTVDKAMAKLTQQFTENPPTGLLNKLCEMKPKKPRKPYTRKPKVVPIVDTIEEHGIDFDVEREQLAREKVESPIEKVKPTIVKLRTKVVDENGDIRRGSDSPKGRNTIQARVEPFTVHKRPNLFQDPKSWAGAAAKEYERSGEARKDKRLDKVLIGDNQPVQRRGEAVQAEVECVHCGKVYIVPIDTVLPDQDDGTVRYICDNCIRRSK